MQKKNDPLENWCFKIINHPEPPQLSCRRRIAATFHAETLIIQFATMGFLDT